MDTCPYSLQLGVFHDGELPEGERRELEQHLTGACPVCLAELAQLRRLSALLEAASWPQLSADARQGLYRLAPNVADYTYLRIAKWTTGLAASVLLAASGWMMVHQHGNTPPGDAPQPWVQFAISPPESSSAEAIGADTTFADWMMTNLHERQP
jgi:anti-sigma factor RsiW